MDVSSLTPRGPLGGCFSHQIPALTSVLKACFFAPGGGFALSCWNLSNSSTVFHVSGEFVYLFFLFSLAVAKQNILFSVWYKGLVLQEWSAIPISGFLCKKHSAKCLTVVNFMITKHFFFLLFFLESLLVCWFGHLHIGCAPSWGGARSCPKKTKQNQKKMVVKVCKSRISLQTSWLNFNPALTHAHAMPPFVFKVIFGRPSLSFLWLITAAKTVPFASCLHVFLSYAGFPPPTSPSSRSPKTCKAA